MKKLIYTFLLLLGLSSPALAQNPTCPTRPVGDSSNACASTAFVQNAIGASCTTLGGFLVGTGSGVTCSTSAAPLAAVLNGTLNLNPLVGSTQRSINTTVTISGGPYPGAIYSQLHQGTGNAVFQGNGLPGTGTGANWALAQFSGSIGASYDTWDSLGAQVVGQAYTISAGMVTNAANNTKSDLVGISCGFLNNFNVPNARGYGCVSSATVGASGTTTTLIGHEIASSIISGGVVQDRLAANLISYWTGTASRLNTAISIMRGNAGGEFSAALTLNPYQDGATVTNVLKTTGDVIYVPTAQTFNSFINAPLATTSYVFLTQHSILTGNGILTLGDATVAGGIALKGAGGDNLQLIFQHGATQNFIGGAVAATAYFTSVGAAANAWQVDKATNLLSTPSGLTVSGTFTLNGATSGSGIIKTQSVAGTPTLTLGTNSGTPAVTATSPLVITTATGNITCPTCATSSGGGATTGTAPIAVSAAGVVSLNDAGVTYAKIQNLGALAIMGRSANSSGVGADIQATAASDAVFRESGSTIGFGTIATAGIANNAVTLAKLATQTANTTVGNATSGTAVPTALAMPSCSTASSALNYTTSAGASAWTCNTSITANAVAVGGITGLGTGVVTALAINVGSAGAFVTFNGALGTPSSGTVTNLTGTASININGTVGAVTPTTGAFTTITATGATITLSNAAPILTINKAASGADNYLLGQTAGSNRWIADLGNNVAESGANAGTNFDINRYSDAGSFLATAFSITRSTGAVSIAATLSILGIASDTATVDNTMCITSAGLTLKGTGTLGICLGTSGAQFKTAFAPMAAGIDDLMKINFQNYRYLNGFGDNGARMQYGTTAQDVEKVIPDLVRYDTYGNPLNYDSGALLFIGLRSIQQLKADNDNLREELKLRKAQ